MKPGLTLLLVEDNAADIRITQRAVHESGLPIHLLVRRDGQEAVDYLFRRGAAAHDPDWRVPDLILLDLNLPLLTGLQVLDQVRASADLRAVPVVVFSTSGREEEVRLAYAAGANTYIQKPQEFQQLVEVMRALGHYWLHAALLPNLG